MDAWSGTAEGAEDAASSAKTSLLKSMVKLLGVYAGGGAIAVTTITTGENLASSKATQAKQAYYQAETTDNQLATNSANTAEQNINQGDTQIENSTKQNQAGAQLSSQIFQTMTQIFSISNGR